MRNRYLEKCDSVVKVRISGKNVRRYVDRIYRERIDILNLVFVSNREVFITVRYGDYYKIKDIKSILYKVEIVNYMGKLGIKYRIKKNIFLFLFLIIGILIIVFLSNIIFSVEVIHQDKGIRELVMRELSLEHIDKYYFKKSYLELEKIEDKILNKYKDRLEWIEISDSGTKYIVRVEERKVNDVEKSNRYCDIVSRKDGVIVSVRAYSGEKVKEVNDFVKKGDVIISSYVTLPDNTKVPVIAKGEVLGEVWYTVKIDYPFVYQESKLTGRVRNAISICFFGKRIGVFDFGNYRTFSSKNKVLFSSMLLNIGVIYERQYETVVLDSVYTEDLVINKAIDYIKNKLLSDNSYMKSVEEVKVLNYSVDDDSIRMNVFIRAIENIGKECSLSN